MLVRFSSTKTESITMFGDVAVRLIKLLGASGKVPGAIASVDIPTALQILRDRLQATEDESAIDNNKEDEEREEPIDLYTRAVPLIDILQRAAAANVPVMWEKL